MRFREEEGQKKGKNMERRLIKKMKKGRREEK